MFTMTTGYSLINAAAGTGHRLLVGNGWWMLGGWGSWLIYEWSFVSEAVWVLLAVVHSNKKFLFCLHGVCVNFWVTSNRIHIYTIHICIVWLYIVKYPVVILKWKNSLWLIIILSLVEMSVDIYRWSIGWTISPGLKGLYTEYNCYWQWIAWGWVAFQSLRS